MAVQLLLDTDIGSDIDDAACLAYLLAKPDCELLGITTVSGEPERRASMASALCKLAGKDIPIYPGAAEPLLVESRQPKAPQADALARWPHATDFPRGEAIEFLRHTIRQRAGEIILLTIGPLTNVALLFKADPEIPALLKGMVSMGGLFDPVRTRYWRGSKWEWNIYCDPHAAAIVYRAPLAAHRTVGLDVTTQVTMDATEVRRRFQAPLLQPVLDFAEVWFRSADKITFHDPLAAATIFDEAICAFERGEVQVELHDPDAFAVTRWSPRAPGRHEIATQVDAARFFAEYFAALAS
ncbi:MAG: nucleoside hydrolase [Thermoflexales bacterium]|nr:nucleoside hydrolase [Thermoflexales bacterium]MDW8351767.1 nucleoside hydrolase [Anaerolineae bacterium]